MLSKKDCNSSIHINTKYKVRFEYVDADSDVSYPSEWFQKNPNVKPSCWLPNYTGTFEEIKKCVIGGIRGANLSLKSALIYLYLYAKEMRETLMEDWISFGCVIGQKGNDINPWNILTINLGEPYIPTETAWANAQPNQVIGDVDPGSWSELALALFNVCIYRLARVTNEDYRDILIKRMEDQLNVEGGKGMSFHGAAGTYSSWQNDRSYIRMIAAVDMFLYKFRTNGSAILRMGTLGSRYRDCSGLISMGYMTKILNEESGNIMDWIFIKTMGEEMVRVSKEGQESGAPTYFPYQADLGLVVRSYSSNANPYLFHWIHIIRGLIGHKRSQNGRFNFEGSFSDICLNAVIVVWVYARGGDLDPQFSSDGKPVGLDIEISSEEVEAGPNISELDKLWLTTQGKDPATWFALLKGNGFKVPEIVQKAVKRQRDKILDVRADSIGDFIKNRMVF